MDVYGGKANLLATDLRQWFETFSLGQAGAAT